MFLFKPIMTEICIALGPPHAAIILIMVLVYCMFTIKIKDRKGRLRLIGVLGLLTCLSPFVIHAVDGDEGPENENDVITTATFFGVVYLIVMIVLVSVPMPQPKSVCTGTEASSNVNVEEVFARPATPQPSREREFRGIRPTFRGIEKNPIHQRNEDLMRSYSSVIDYR
jgi:hypothetical protein